MTTEAQKQEVREALEVFRSRYYQFYHPVRGWNCPVYLLSSVQSAWDKYLTLRNRHGDYR